MTRRVGDTCTSQVSDKRRQTAVKDRKEMGMDKSLEASCVHTYIHALLMFRSIVFDLISKRCDVPWIVLCTVHVTMAYMM